MKTTLSRRRFVAYCTMPALGLAAPRMGMAAGWPEKPITVVLPSSAGSAFDNNLRTAAEHMGRVLGQPLVIDNRPGAGGIIAMQAVSRARADGYTLGMGNTASLAITPALNPAAGYDPMKSFAYVGRFTSQANLLVVRRELPARTLAELTRYARENPGRLSMGSQGTGSSGHMSGELYKRVAGVDFVHVPYKGGVQSTQDLLAGLVDFQFENVATIEPFVTSGRVRALAITSSRRHPRFPDLPTMQEAGLPGYEVLSWSGLVAPAGTPKEIVDRLNRAMNSVLQMPAVKAQIQERGAIIEGGSPAAFGAFASSEQAKWRALVVMMNRPIDGGVR